MINLESRRDRHREMDRQLRSIGLSLDCRPIELFSAIRPADKGEFDSVGTRGCFMSHLGVLQRAVSGAYARILIFEDDLNFVAGFKERLAAAVAVLDNCPWDLFYGGYLLPDGVTFASGVQYVSPKQALVAAHFLALSARAVALAAPFLETLLSHKAGDPNGGPMHVDGAYSWLRQANPQLITRIAVPPLGYQRASRTDIHQLRWFDRFPITRHAVSVARIVKNFLR